ncbi:SRPBCC domain-containing protein [Nitratireductor kimnyeongensis]|uniref:SRPBCC domain-containing protein n=1 Tax=Nitratireductor kimnyeongensis TaxID=430679 RepID=A0ABW0TAW2_9HYPH|nr:SRPBCC domain-containing protein [Nitratireductor kimnyeongensis]QZZ35683.1 SRPBCC domain-containing protein [Nitratireductor kimnyeongensis]
MSNSEVEKSNETITLEYLLDSSPEKVWRALTIRELAEIWLGEPDGVTGMPEYEMLDTIPFSKVRYALRDIETDAPHTLVTFEIAPAPGGKTWFRLTHSPRALTRMAANTNGAPTALAA